MSVEVGGGNRFGDPMRTEHNYTTVEEEEPNSSSSSSSSVGRRTNVGVSPDFDPPPLFFPSKIYQGAPHDFWNVFDARSLLVGVESVGQGFKGDSYAF